MEILSFTIKGKMAHFRKYYANNTAFSFSIPPRTTLMGITAAVMGWPKDSYYEKLNSEHISFGIRVLSPLKKSFHRLNFLKINSVSDLRGRKGRIQTPFEIISPWDLKKDNVSYQVFITPSTSGRKIFEDIKKQFLTKEPVYNITLGSANFSAQINDCQLISAEHITEKKVNGFVPVHSAIPVELVEELHFKKENQKDYNFVEEDMLPGDFVANDNREVSQMNRLLFSITPNPLRVKLRKPFFEIKTKTETLNIQFMNQ